MNLSRKRAHFRPKDNAPCLCGSGRTFAACCSDQLPGFDRGDRLKIAWEKGDWEEALIASRSDFSQYTIWHKTNTEPALAQHNPAAVRLLTVDIAALGEMAGDMCTLHFRLDRQAELPAMLERIRPNINDVRWQRKLTYYQALVSDARGDGAAARSEFQKLGPIRADEKDEEILQAYLDLFGGELSFARKIEICDQIIRLSPGSSDHLQYGGLKGFSYGEIGDFDHARKEFAAAIAYARMRSKEKPLSLRAKHLMAGNLVMLALLSREDKRFLEAEKLLNELLAEADAWSATGRGSLNDELGECYRYWGKWKEGEDAYRKSLAIRANGISSVFLAECILRQERKEEAFRIIDCVDFGALGRNEKLDYAYTVAAIAVESADRGRLSSALKILQSVTASAPYFEQRRLKFIIEVQESIANGPTPNMWGAMRKFLSEPLRTISRYTILQPNVAGIGININAMIDAATKPKHGGEKTD